ncbi:MAG TPA: endolytic transglycosylase MltG, partial [Candidatus Binatus sp.]|nr:endolytic transglycosylase MltG [Candidatus Binatus sp.]
MKRAAALLVVVGIIAGAYTAFQYYWLSPTERFAPPHEVTIEKGESFRQIARALAEAGVVRSELALRIYGRLSLTASKIQPGDYAFKGGERMPDVMRHLVRGDFIVVAITIPEGLTVHEIAERV